MKGDIQPSLHPVLRRIADMLFRHGSYLFHRTSKCRFDDQSQLCNPSASTPGVDPGCRDTGRRIPTDRGGCQHCLAAWHHSELLPWELVSFGRGSPRSMRAHRRALHDQQGVPVRRDWGLS